MCKPLQNDVKACFAHRHEKTRINDTLALKFRDVIELGFISVLLNSEEIIENNCKIIEKLLFPIPKIMDIEI